MLESSLSDILFEKLTQAAERVRGMRMNASLPDLDFALAGISRVFSKSKSGREWLQCNLDFEICRSTFFDALGSARRKEAIWALAHRFAEGLCKAMREAGVDFLADMPKLENVGVVAVDGHEIEHPQHAARDRKGRFTTMATIYQMDLHTGLSLPLQGWARTGSRPTSGPHSSGSSPGRSRRAKAIPPYST